MRFQYFAILLAIVSGFTTLAQQPPDSFQVTDPLDITKDPAPVIDITNKSSAPICLNTYIYSTVPGREKTLAACCATLIEPSAMYTLDSRNQADYGNDVAGTIHLPSVRIKLLATTPIPGYNACNPAGPTPETLATGLSASINGAPLANITLDVNELNLTAQVCGFIEANGYGYGICGPAPMAPVLSLRRVPYWQPIGKLIGLSFCICPEVGEM